MQADADEPAGEPADEPAGEPEGIEPAREPPPEHDVLVRFRLGNRAMGSNSERQDLEALAEELEAEVAAAGAGEYDGDELGGGECTMFFAGPDADRLFAVLQPVLRRHPRGRDAQVTLQYGTGVPVTRRV